LGGLYGHEAQETDKFITLLGDVHHCGQILMMSVDTFCGNFSVYPHDTKNQPMLHHILMLPLWCNICRILIGLTLEENIGIKSGEGPSIAVIFFSIWHIVGDGQLAMNGASQKVGVHLILYFKVGSM